MYFYIYIYSIHTHRQLWWFCRGRERYWLVSRACYVHAIPSSDNRYRRSCREAGKRIVPAVIECNLVSMLNGGLKQCNVSASGGTLPRVTNAVHFTVYDSGKNATVPVTHSGRQSSTHPRQTRTLHSRTRNMANFFFGILWRTDNNVVVGGMDMRYSHWPTICLGLVNQITSTYGGVPTHKWQSCFTERRLHSTRSLSSQKSRQHRRHGSLV